MEKEILFEQLIQNLYQESIHLLKSKLKYLSAWECLARPLHLCLFERFLYIHTFFILCILCQIKASELLMQQRHEFAKLYGDFKEIITQHTDDNPPI